MTRIWKMSYPRCGEEPEQSLNAISSTNVSHQLTLCRKPYIYTFTNIQYISDNDTQSHFCRRNAYSHRRRQIFHVIRPAVLIRTSTKCKTSRPRFSQCAHTEVAQSQHLNSLWERMFDRKTSSRSRSWNGIHTFLWAAGIYTPADTVFM